jgi:deoxyguanosine kinase
MAYNFIAVEGNIGVGKTTVAKLLAEHYQAKLVLEQFTENPFLSDFYKDGGKCALPVELHFLMDRYAQMKPLKPSQAPIVSDYFYNKSHLFAGVNLPEESFELFKKIANGLQPKLMVPDLLIYLHAPVSQLLQNIKERNRSFEQNIAPEYLEKLQAAYQNFLRPQAKVLRIEMQGVNFNEPKQFQQLIDFLDKDYDFENHILNIE